MGNGVSLERTRWETGPHKIEVEAPDILHLYANGDITLVQEEVVPKIGEADVTRRELG